MDPSDVSDGDLDDESSAGDVEEQEAQEQRTSLKAALPESEKREEGGRT